MNDTIPTKLAYCYNEDDTINMDKCYIMRHSQRRMEEDEEVEMLKER